jgi:GT2 family glycosyltransferase
VAAKLSIVVCLTSGAPDDLRRCLRSLGAQAPAGELEVLVPYDDPVAEVAALAPEFPSARFLRAPRLDSDRARAGASREHHDTLRTIGIRAATGEVIALVEDHAYCADDWRAEMLAALERHPRAAAIGGAVDCESSRTLAWAVWFCDFGRYQSPLPEARAEYVSDTNVAYRRAALEQVGGAWKDDYHETSVHWAMSAAGFELWTTPRAVVRQARGDLRWGEALRERFVWGRSFAGTRAQSLGAQRWLFAVLSPALPLLRTSRFGRTAFARGRNGGRFVACLPAILVLECVWAVGELAGYVTASPD